MSAPPTRPVAVVAVLAALVVAVGVVAIVVLRAEQPPATKPWVLVEGPGFTVNLPVPAAPATIAGGKVHRETALVGDHAYTVAWSSVHPGTQPLVALNTALHALTGASAVVVRAHPAQTGPFVSVDVTARFGGDYVHGRILVVGARIYLVAEISPEVVAPADVTRLLAGFDPDPSAT